MGIWDLETGRQVLSLNGYHFADIRGRNCLMRSVSSRGPATIRSALGRLEQGNA